MARSTITQRIALEGVAQIRKDLEALGVTGEKAVKQIQDAAGGPTGSGGASKGISTLAARFSVARTQLEPFKESIFKAAEGFRELGRQGTEMARKVAEVTGIGLAGGIVALIDQTKHAVDAFDNLKDTAEALGTTTEKLQTIRLAGAFSGINPDDITKAWSRFNVALGNAIKQTDGYQVSFKGAVDVVRGGVADLSDSVNVLRGNTKATTGEMTRGVTVLRGGVKPAVDATANAFRELNFSQDEIKQMGKSDQFESMRIVAQKIETLTSTADRARIASELFSRSYVKILPLIADGTATIDRAGAIVSGVKLFPLPGEEKENERIMAQFGQMELVGGFLKDLFLNKVAAGFVPLLQKINAFLLASVQSVRDWGATVENYIRGVSNTVIAFFDPNFIGPMDPNNTTVQVLTAIIKLKDEAVAAGPAIAAAFRGVVSVLGGIATVVNTIFGTEWNATTVAALVVIGSLTGAFTALSTILTVCGALAAALGTVIIAIGTVLGIPALAVAAIVGAVVGVAFAVYKNWDTIKAFAKAVWQYVSDTAVSIFNGLASFFDSWWQQTKANWQAFADWVGLLFSDPLAAMVKLWNWAFDFIGGLIDWLYKKLTSLATKAAQVIADASVANTAAGINAPAFAYASGGLISGPGTGTSDSVLARVSDGEFVQRKSAVDFWGVGFMNMLNNVRGFADGGLVSALSAAVSPGGIRGFAGGGMMSAAAAGGGGPATPIQLSIFGDDMGTVLAPAAVASKVIRYAHQRQILSTGRKPGWRAGR